MTPTIRVAAAFVDVEDRANPPRVLIVSRRVMGIWGTLACYQISEEEGLERVFTFLRTTYFLDEAAMKIDFRRHLANVARPGFFDPVMVEGESCASFQEEDFAGL